MRVVFAHRIANRARRFAVRFVMRVADLMHRKQNPAVHRFQAITQIGNGPADNHAHRVIQIGRFHLINDAYLRAVVVGAHRDFVCILNIFWLVGQNTRSFLEYR